MSLGLKLQELQHLQCKLTIEGRDAPDCKGEMPKEKNEMFTHDGSSGDGGDPQVQGDNQQPPQAPSTFQSLYDTLDEAGRGLIDQHITGLKNTVQATREERDTLSQRLSDVTKKLGKDPDEAKRMLDEMSSGLESANRRATFAEEAIRPEVGCVNPKAAWALAQADGLFDQRGNPNWAALKEAAPELFRQAMPAGNAGSGTGGQSNGGKTSMDDFIRAKAGVRT